MTETASVSNGAPRCPWCGKSLVLGQRRHGTMQRFCSPKCRHEFQSSARRWATMLFEAGIITVETLKAAQRSVRAFCGAFGGTTEDRQGGAARPLPKIEN